MEPEVSSITDLLPVNNNNNNKVNNFNVIKIMIIIIIIIIMAMIRILMIIMMIMDVIWTLRREGGGGPGRCQLTIWKNAQKFMTRCSRSNVVNK